MCSHVVKSLVAWGLKVVCFVFVFYIFYIIFWFFAHYFCPLAFSSKKSTPKIWKRFYLTTEKQECCGVFGVNAKQSLHPVALREAKIRSCMFVTGMLAINQLDV